MNFALVTAHNEGYQPLADITWNQNKLLYAERHGYDAIAKTDGEKILAKQRAWAHSRDHDPNHSKLKFDSSTPEEALARFLADYKLTPVPLEEGLQPQYILDNLVELRDYLSL